MTKAEARKLKVGDVVVHDEQGPFRVTKAYSTESYLKWYVGIDDNIYNTGHPHSTTYWHIGPHNSKEFSRRE